MGIVQHDETITIEANRLRNEQLKRFYSPETGEGSDTGDRRPIRIGDAPLPLQYIPAAMFDEPLVQQLAQAGSLAGYLRQQGVDTPGEGHTLLPNGESDDEGDISPLLSLWREWIRVRIRYDFEFWAYSFVRIKNKLGADDIPFRLNRPQRRILGMLESMRTTDRPIRLILLKARQWGGSTLIQIYMAWIQLVHRHNWNSVICAHIKEAAANIKGVRVRYVPSAALKNDLKLDRVSLRNVTPAASGGDDEGDGGPLAGGEGLTEEGEAEEGCGGGFKAHEHAVGLRRHDAQCHDFQTVVGETAVRQ